VNRRRRPQVSADYNFDIRESLLQQTTLNKPVICDGKALVEFSCPGRIEVDLSTVKKSVHGFWLAKAKFVFDEPLDMSTPSQLIVHATTRPTEDLNNDDTSETVFSETKTKTETSIETETTTKTETKTDAKTESVKGSANIDLEPYEDIWNLAKEIQIKLSQQIVRAGNSGRTLFVVKHGPLWQLGLQPKSVDFELFSFWICKVLTMPPQTKRQLVKLTRTGDRLRSLLEVLTAAGGANVLSLSLGTYDSSEGWSILLFRNTRQSLYLVILFVGICALGALWKSSPEPMSVLSQRISLSQVALQNRVMSALNSVSPDQQNLVNRLLRDQANRFVAF